MNINQMKAFDGCHLMRQEDIGLFANTLADGFSEYDLFKYACNGKYSHKKMSVFWAVSIAALGKDAICIADSKSANSVLVYVRPNSKEPGLMEYLRAGGVKMLFTVGLRSAVKLLSFDSQAQKVAKRHKTANCGYLMAFATKIDKQGQHYGKPLVQALLKYLDASGEDCYLETLKAENVDLYRHFSFQLKEQTPLSSGNLTMYAMHRPHNASEK